MTSESVLQKIQIFPSLDSYEQNQSSVGENDIALVPAEYIPAAEKDAANGVAGLDGSGKVKPEQASAGIVIVTANRTLSATDNNRCLCCTNTAAITITVSNTQGLPVGAEIEVIQGGAGAVSFAASGVTLISLDGAVSIAGQYGVAALKQTATNVWVLCGALA